AWARVAHQYRPHSQRVEVRHVRSRRWAGPAGAEHSQGERSMKQVMYALTPVFPLTPIASTTQAQGLSFAPSKGQSADQQGKDGAECQAVAVQQSGFEPA